MVGVGIAALTCPVLATPVYWHDNRAGWFWYETRPQPLPPPVPVAATPAPAPETQAAQLELERPELIAHRKLQQRLEDLRIIAIMEPTAGNVEGYLRVQREVMDRAATFADVWQRVVWTTPDLDYQFQHRPTNAPAIHAWEERRHNDRDTLVQRAATDHGLFFLFGPDCLHCAQMAQTLRRLAARHGFEVQAVTLDGAVHPAFPDAWPDNGFAAAAGVERFPATVLARLTPGDEAVFPLGFGALAEVELEERIAVLTGVAIGTRF